jgi:hypothetical protein
MPLTQICVSVRRHKDYSPCQYFDPKSVKAARCGTVCTDVTVNINFTHPSAIPLARA